MVDAAGGHRVDETWRSLERQAGPEVQGHSANALARGVPAVRGFSAIVNGGRRPEVGIEQRVELVMK